MTDSSSIIFSKVFFSIFHLSSFSVRLISHFVCKIIAITVKLCHSVNILCL